MNKHSLYHSILLPLTLFALVCNSNYANAGNLANDQLEITRTRNVQINAIEKTLRMPRGASKISEYKRYYAWPKKKNGIIKAIFVRNSASPGIELVSFSDLPTIDDGGCNVVELSYSIKMKKTIKFFCHGVG